MLLVVRSVWTRSASALPPLGRRAAINLLFVVAAMRRRAFAKSQTVPEAISDCADPVTPYISGEQHITGKQG